jgi:serine/threonine-protein kinase ATR
LPAEAQVIIRPFLNSHYYELQKNIPSSEGVIYKVTMAYRKWVIDWVLLLIDRTKHPIFQSCRGVVKVDIDTAHFLLPHLVLYCLTNGATQDYKQIRDEIMAVISNSSDMSPHKNAAVSSLVKSVNRELT